jgi:uncharacterized 2Fe-2S/4Fe-4S cluster protein (DUF4445 family)
MAEHKVTFDNGDPVIVQTGTLLIDAALRAGVNIVQPCGSQGRCGRCAVKVLDGGVRRRSTLRLSPEDINEGYALACQSVIEGDAHVLVPDQDTLERHLTTDRLVAEVTVPEGYDPQVDQTVRRVRLTLTPPTMDDQRDDWSRLEKEIRQQTETDTLSVSLTVLQRIGAVLREGAWQVTALVSFEDSTIADSERKCTLVDLIPGHVPDEEPLWGISIDIGTTTVSVWLVDLISGQVVAQTAEYNRQIRRGEDVISRVIFAGKKNGQDELRELVLTSINTLIERACTKASSKRDADDDQALINCSPGDIVKATIVGNSIMMHLLLGIPAESIRQSPFVPAINKLPVFNAREVGLDIYQDAPVLCLPGVASYVGADISAGVLSSRLVDEEEVTLFMDIGTNGEIVLGDRDWLVTCACSAGPAFEGAGVTDGMRATRGAIEEVWIDNHTCLLYTSPSPRDRQKSRMPSSA